MRNPVPLIALLAIIALASAGSDLPSTTVPAAPKAYPSFKLNPIADLAPAFRQRNWSTAGGGSCVIATTIYLLRWQGLHAEADAWRQLYGGGQTSSSHLAKLNQRNLRYLMTTDGDTQLLEYGLATRRGVGVTWSPNHFVALVGRVNNEAIIWDNNKPNEFIRQPWQAFVQEWTSRGGWGVVLVCDDPHPPVPL